MTEVKRGQWKDKASSTHRTLGDTLRAWRLARLRGVRAGSHIIVKPGVEVRVAEGGVLEIGDHAIIDNHAFLQLTKPAPHLTIGRHVGIGRHCVIAVKGRMVIGDYTQIGPYCQIIDQDHSFRRDDLIINQSAYVRAVTIGRDCWFGSGVRVLKGATVHDGAVIGAGSVVTGDVPAYEVWGGVPARFLKRRE
jgi:acetyltransferase-like isoleucine patch superfamily enzyme